MWPDMIEFRSASSETAKKEDEEETLAKHKSADNYVGRPNNDTNRNIW